MLLYLTISWGKISGKCQPFEIQVFLAIRRQSEFTLIVTDRRHYKKNIEAIIFKHLF